MYTNFRIQNFRGFKDLELKDIKRVNLIAGKNNVGKTSLLEALFIYGNPSNPELALRVSSFRGLNRFRMSLFNHGSTPWDSLFNKFDNKQTIQLSGIHTILGDITAKIRTPDVERDAEASITVSTEVSDESALSSTARQTLMYEVTKNNKVKSKHQLLITDAGTHITPPLPIPNFQHYFFSSTVRESFEVIAERWSSLYSEGLEDLVLETLKTVEPRLIKLDLLFLNGEPIIHGMLDSKLRVPIIFMGDGIVRLLQFILAIGNARNGFVLIDEIENGLHYSVQTDVWKAIAKAAELFNVQVFATTHSREMAMAAHEAFKDAESYDFKYYRLDRNVKTHEIEAVAYSERIMEAAEEMDAEVRG